MLVKEFLQLLRDPRMRIIVFVMPLVQMLIMAYALTTDVTNVRIAVLDEDRTPTSRELVARFTSSGYFEVYDYVENPDDLTRLLDYGTVLAVIHIPPGFEGEINAGRTSVVQVISDGTDSNTSAIVFGYSNIIIGDYATDLLIEILDNRTGGVVGMGMVEFENRAWYNPNLESKYFFVPGLIGLMLQVVTMLLTSIAIVREKEIGTIEQLMVTPISRTEFILGKTIPFVLIGYMVMTIMLVLAIPVFGIRVVGGFPLLYALTGIFLVGNLGLALVISAVSRTQQQALLTAFFFMMPIVLLSGYIIPLHNMPEEIKVLTLLNPMKWYIDILRGVVMKGASLKALLPAITGQTILAAGFLILAAFNTKKTVG